MKLEEFKTKKQESVLQSMIDYMNANEEEKYEVGYTQKNIDECGQLLDNYIDDLVKSEKDEKIIEESIKKVVLGLNELNVKCEFELIETGQREDLCQFIEDASIVAGLPKSEEDATEEWRQW